MDVLILTMLSSYLLHFSPLLLVLELMLDSQICLGRRGAAADKGEGRSYLFPVVLFFQAPQVGEGNLAHCVIQGDPKLIVLLICIFWSKSGVDRLWSSRSASMNLTNGQRFGELESTTSGRSQPSYPRVRVIQSIIMACPIIPLRKKLSFGTIRQPLREQNVLAAFVLYSWVHLLY